MAGSNNESDDASFHSEATIAQQQQNIQPQIIITVSNNNAKFPYLKKDEYEMKPLLFRGNQRQEYLCFSFIPYDHVADFHYMDDARDIWNVVKARFGGNAESKKMRKSMLKQEFLEFRISKAERLHKGYDRMQKILSQLNQLKAKPEDEDINLKFLRALPSSWSQVVQAILHLPTLLHQTLRLGLTDLIEKIDLEEMDLKWKIAMLSVRVHTFEQKAGRKIDFDKKESARFNKKKVRCYKCLQRGHFAKECRAKGGNDKQRYSSFKIQEIGKKEEDSKALITEFGMIAGCDTEDAIEEGAAKIYNLITGANTKEVSTAGDAGEFALMGVTSEYLTALLTAKKDLQTKLDNHLVQTEKWRTSSKNLFRLVDSSMSIRTKVGLGFNNYIGGNALGWDDYAFSVFTTNSEEVKGRPHFNRFAKTDSMKAVHPPLAGDYTPLSDHTDLDESQMSYGTKSLTSGDSNSVSNDFVSCDNSDKSSEVNSNDFASSDSSVKTSEPKSNDSTSCASTSSISTSESEAEIESYAGTPIQEPIIVQDLPSFSCNSSDKNENTSRTSCNKNGYFNKKASHFRKNNSSTSKSCFVCGSYLHLIKDCNYYETQYANDFDGVGYPQREPIWDNATRVTQSNHFVPQAVLLRSGKVSIPAARPNQVSTGRPKPVSTGRPKPVPTDKPKVPEPVPTGRRYSPSVTSGWWKSTARPMPHLNRPTSSYFQTYTPYVPQVYYNHMQYGGVRWATAVKPSAGCSWKTHRKGLYWENSYTDAEDEGIFDSGCSRSMTGNMERLDDFQEFRGKVTFGGGEGRITGKGAIRTPTLDFENVYYVKELQHFNLFSISQICDKKNRVLFTDTDCLVLSKDFMLPDESMV
ncbi:putative ribonuclease H-like domain-containing protein, partial [Tanacetum coccineum]